jgi:hypothetical protein
VTEPRRIQRQRTRGWRLPVGAVYVGRLSTWGNPFGSGERFNGVVLDHAMAVFMFRSYAVPRGASDPTWLAPLRGHDLACWCPTCDAHRDGLPLGVVCPDCAPCHGDVLLSLANQ